MTTTITTRKRCSVAAIAAALVASCASDRTVPFSERPELREETVPGCGGGQLRFLVPAHAERALTEAAQAELAGEAAHELESVRVPCELCDARGGVCGTALARFSDALDGRTGLELRFRATVASSEDAGSWRLTESHRTLDHTRLVGGLPSEEAARVLDWARAHLALEREPVELAGPDALPRRAPDGARFRLDELVRVGEGTLVVRRVFLADRDDGLSVLTDERVEVPVGAAASAATR